MLIMELEPPALGKGSGESACFLRHGMYRRGAMRDG